MIEYRSALLVEEEEEKGTPRTAITDCLPDLSLSFCPIVPFWYLNKATIGRQSFRSLSLSSTVITDEDKIEREKSAATTRGKRVGYARMRDACIIIGQEQHCSRPRRFQAAI